MDILKHIIIFAFLIIGGCSKTTPVNSTVVLDTKEVRQNILLGEVESAEGVKINMDAVSNDSIVIVFASDTCVTCTEESQYWVNQFKDGIPSNIYFMHLIIGGVREDALDWKEANGISWDVAIDLNNDSLFRMHCSEVRTPCFLIVNRKSGKTFQSYEVLKWEQVKELSGK